MSIYERLGVRPIINVVGAATAYGGELMDEEALEAMHEAAKQSVHLDELQAAANKVIAQRTHAEAGIVTAGASAALTLGTAACIAGLDLTRMDQLPDTTGMPNEVILPWQHIRGYDHAISLAGARILGRRTPNGTTPPEEARIISKGDIESAITEKTVAIVYGQRLGSHPPLEEVIEISKRYNIPLMVDAAAQAPPVENLHRFIDMGADLVCFSGGKGIRGPQASGILCGRRELIASAFIQMRPGTGGTFDKWNPPASLIPKDRLRRMPEHGIGRGMKVTKEAIVGLLVALQNFTEKKVPKRIEPLRQLLEGIGTRLDGIAGVEVGWTEAEGDFGPPGAFPVLEVKIDEQVVGRSAAEVSQRLKDGEPSIYVRDWSSDKGLVLLISSSSLDEETARIVGERLHTAITG